MRSPGAHQLRLALLVLCAGACAGDEEPPDRVDIVRDSGPRYRVETDLGAFVVSLDTLHAPLTAERFALRADAGAYDGSSFHRRVEGELIVGGRIEGDDPVAGVLAFEQGSGEHSLGAMGMVRSEDPEALGDQPERREFLDSARSEFFVCLSRLAHLDGKYVVFGRVVEGMETVRAIVRHDGEDDPRMSVVERADALRLDERQ